MNTDTVPVIHDRQQDDTASVLAGLTAEQSKQIARMMQTTQYVVRHRCGAPVRVYPTRQQARARVDQVDPPERFQLRVAVATRADMMATLLQRHCTHIRR